MNIQEIINSYSGKLEKSYEIFKDSKSVLKDMKNNLKNDLKQNDEWVELDEKIKLLKVNRKDLSEQIKDLDKQQDQIASEFDLYQEVQDFVADSEEKYNEQKDKNLNGLSKELYEKGLNMEIEYKGGKLFLVVAKHT